MEYIYEYYGENMSGRIKVGEKITKEMFDSGTSVEIENFIIRKEMVYNDKKKKGESPIKEVTTEKWLPGFIRLNKVNIMYEIEQK